MTEPARRALMPVAAYAPLACAALGLVSGLLLAPLPPASLWVAPLLLVAAALPAARPAALALAWGLVAGGPGAGRPPLDGLPRWAEVEGTVRAADPPGGGDSRFVLELERAADGGGAAARVLVRWIAPARDGVRPDVVLPGDRVRSRLRLVPLPSQRAPGAYDPAPLHRRMALDALGEAEGRDAVTRLREGDGLATWLGRLRAAAARALDTALPAEDAGLARALVLGDRGRLTDEDARLFRVAGQGHLVAVSGQHVVLVLAAVLLLTRAMRLSLRASWVLGLVTVALYVPLSGAAPSAVRAGVGGSLWLLARLLGRQPVGHELLAATALAMLLAAPEDLHDLGFLLSFAAVLGIERLAPRLLAGVAAPRPRIPGLLEPRPPRLRQALCVATAAWLAGAPLALHAFGQLAPAAVPLALPCVPLAALLLALGALLVPLSGVPVAGALLADGFQALGTLLRVLLRLPERCGLATLEAAPPGDLWLAANVALLALAGLGPRRLLRWALLGVGTLLLGALAPRGSPPPEALTAWALDVGRAHAVLVRAPDGQNALLGVGNVAPGDPVARLLLPALRALGITHLQVVWCTERGGASARAAARVAAALETARVAIPREDGKPHTLLEGPWGRLVARGPPGAARVHYVTRTRRVRLAPPAVDSMEGTLVWSAATPRRGWAPRTDDATDAGRYARPAMNASMPPDLEVLGVFAAALAAFAVLCVRPLDWLRPTAAACAFLLGVLVVASLGFAAFAALVVPFVAATLAGRLPGRTRERGRSLRQVLANGLPAFVGAGLAWAGAPGAGAAVLVGSFACLGADTLATELGTRYGGTPRSLWGGRTLARGESGGVTGVGLLATLLGAALAPLAYASLAPLPLRTFAWLAAAGVAGGLLDSILGATLQYRGRDARTGRVVEARFVDGVPTERVSGWRWLDNDAVNLVTVCFAALLAWRLTAS